MLTERYPEVLPPTYHNTGYWACAANPGLCCFHPNHPDLGEYLEEAFTVLQAGPKSQYVYRLHYQKGRHYKDRKDPDIYKLNSVFRVCLDEELCPDGESPPSIDIPDPWSKTPSATKTTPTHTKPSKTKTKTVTTTKTTFKPTSKFTSNTSKSMCKTKSSETESSGLPIFSALPIDQGSKIKTSEPQQVDGPMFSALPIEDFSSVEPPVPITTANPLHTQVVRTTLEKRIRFSSLSLSQSRLQNRYFSFAVTDDTGKSNDESVLAYDLDKLNTNVLRSLMLAATDLAGHQNAEADLSLKFDVDGFYSQSHGFESIRKDSSMSGRLTTSIWGSSALKISKDDLDEDALLGVLLDAIRVDIARGLSFSPVELELSVDAVCSVGDGSAEPTCTNMTIEISGGFVGPIPPSTDKTTTTTTITKTKITTSKTRTETGTKTQPPKTTTNTSKRRSKTSKAKTKTVTKTPPPKTSKATVTRTSTLTSAKSTKSATTTSRKTTTSKIRTTSSPKTSSRTSTWTKTTTKTILHSTSTTKRGTSTKSSSIKFPTTTTTSTWTKTTTKTTPRSTSTTKSVTSTKSSSSIKFPTTTTWTKAPRSTSTSN